MSRLILIVEDSATCAETLQIALESIPGIETRVSHSAKAAFALAEGNDVVAIVTDLHLPQADGFELIRRLRADPRFVRVPILLISGDSDPGLPARALAEGADAFFPKPYSPSAVRRKLEQLI
jgi:two-component system chemotaxis response regulator CheY